MSGVNSSFDAYIIKALKLKKGELLLLLTRAVCCVAKEVGESGVRVFSQTAFYCMYVCKQPISPAAHNVSLCPFIIKGDG